MDHFEKKYGVREDERVKEFHRNRRMFCIYKGEMFIAEPNLEYTHAVWFEKQGWMTKEDDSLIDNIIRGMVDKDGGISFYIGYDMRTIDILGFDLQKYVKELVKELNLKKDAKVFGGWKQLEDKTWQPIKEYGQVGDYV